MMPLVNLEDYKYELPAERIANFPLENRDDSKLLRVNRLDNSITHHQFKDISKLFPINSELFINTSKVISARIPVIKETKGKAEIFLIEPIAPFTEYNLALRVRNNATWKCIIGGKNIKAGDELFADLGEKYGVVKFLVIEKDGNEANVSFDLTENKLSVADLLDKYGQVPLPPYIKRDAQESDKTTYQTVYANSEGSVAAPTAGLHFTKKALKRVISRGMQLNEVILHVGLGTFKPIDTDDVNKHEMHSERVIISKSVLEHLIVCLELNKNIISVGTTTTRTLESIYWLGVRLIENPELEILNDELLVEQQEPYIERENIPSSEAIKAVNAYFDKHKITSLVAKTKLFIVPGYDFRIVNILVTNFHQPDSTLILLVSAFLGEDLWRSAYNAALANEYRFLSYGDANLLIREMY